MADPPSSTSKLHRTVPSQAAAELAPGSFRAGRSQPRRFLYLVLIVSLTLNVAGAAAFATRVVRKGGLRYMLERLDLRDAEPTRIPFQVNLRNVFRKLPNTKDEIIFAGDSLIGDGPWSELYSPIKNRGIGGDRTSGLLERLDELIESHPRKIFFLVGTNCLADDIPVAQVIRNYRKILERTRAESPQTQVFIISVLPVNQHFAHGPVHDNATIRRLNRGLRDLAEQFPGVKFLDVFDALTDNHGDLRKDLTRDGLHLNIDGYMILGKLFESQVVDQGGQER